MLDTARIEQLQRAVAADDWTAAAELCLEIKLKRSDPLDRFRVDELAKAVRRRDVGRIEDIIDGLEYPKP